MEKSNKLYNHENKLNAKLQYNTFGEKSWPSGTLTNNNSKGGKFGKYNSFNGEDCTQLINTKPKDAKFPLPTVEGSDQQDSKRDYRQYMIHATYMTYFCVYGLQMLVSYQYIYERIAMMSPYYDNITAGRSCCGVNKTSPVLKAKEEAQSTAAQWLLYLSAAHGVTSMFAVVIYGANSDKYGRRMLFLLPNTGLLLKMVIYGLSCQYKLPMEVLFAAHLCDGSFGYFVTVLVGASASAADVTTTQKSRTFLVVAVNMLNSFAVGSANFSSGYLISNLGYANTFYLSAGLLAANYILIFMLKETRPKDSDKKSTCDYIKNIFHFYIRKTSHNKRTLYIVMLFTIMLVLFVLVGRGAIDTLYFKHEPFCWDALDIGHYTGIKYFIHPFLSLAILVVFQRCLSDAGIGVLVTLIAVASFALQGLSYNDVMLYAAGIIQFPWIMCASLIKSMMSKITSPHQQGAAQASIAAVEAAVSMLGGLLFNAVYQITITHYNGTIYFIMAAILFLCAIGYAVLAILMRRYMRYGPLTHSQSLEIGDSVTWTEST